MLLVMTPETNKFVGVHSEGAFTLSVVPEDTILLKCWMKLGVLVIVESVSLFFSHSVESAPGQSLFHSIGCVLLLLDAHFVRAGASLSCAA